MGSEVTMTIAFGVGALAGKDLDSDEVVQTRTVQQGR
jgi:hypothetical protein